MKIFVTTCAALALFAGPACADPVTAGTIATLLASTANVTNAAPSVSTTPDGESIVAWVATSGATRTLNVTFLDRTGATVSGPTALNLGGLNPVECDTAATPTGFMVAFDADTAATVGFRDVHFRTFDLTGTQTGSGQANATLTSLDEARPKCDGNFSGDYAIVWARRGAFFAAPSQGIYARRFDNAGIPIDVTEIRIDDPTNLFFSEQDGPNVGLWNSGRLVFAWTDGAFGAAASTTNSPDGHGAGIVARWFDATMAPVTAPTVACDTTTYDQFEALIAVDDRDGCTIGWCGDTLPTLVNAWIRRWDDAGNARDPNDLNITPGNFSSSQFLMGLGMASNGEIVASWHDQTSTTGQPAPRAGWARFDQNRNQYESGLFESGGSANEAHWLPRLDCDQYGNFYAAWQVATLPFNPNNNVQIRGRRYERNMLTFTTNTPAIGGFTSVFIDSPADPNAPYLIGVSGGNGPFFIGSRTVGLTMDDLLTYTTSGGGGQAGPIFYNLAGTLDSTGSTSLPGVILPNYPPIQGLTVYFAFATGNGPASVGGINTIGKAQAVTIL